MAVINKDFRGSRSRGEARIAAICAGGLFLFLSAVALAGADRPPPPRFGGLVVAFGVISGVAYRRLRKRLSHRRLTSADQAFGAACEGWVAGLGLALFALVAGRGEPGVMPSLHARLIGFGVMGALGACAALMLWWIAAGLQRRLPP